MKCTRTRTSMKGLVALLVCVCMCSMMYVDAHVGLTFPPARKYDLDFLDNVRTKPPCGMPKGDVKTSIVSGSTINVTWHLSYPHRGGYLLEVLNSAEKPILSLTPQQGDEKYIKGDPTAQWFQVDLPRNFTCEDCSIRLLRQASEWSNNYRFWSCADVDIVPQSQHKETCFGHGKYNVGRCICAKGFWGNRCQYEDECATDAECSRNGQCIDLGGTALPRKQCFCNPGFHGERCAKKNKFKLPDANKNLDVSRHIKRVLSDKMTVYYKIIPAAADENKEIEFILEIDGTSYGAIGWRPSNMKETCRRWPFIANSTRQGKSADLVASYSEAGAEPEPGAEPEGEPEATGSKKSGKKHHDHDHAHAEPEPEGEPKSDAEPEPEGEPSASGSSKKYKKTHGHDHAHAEPEPEGEPSSDKVHKHDDDPQAHAEPEAAAEPTATSPPKQDSNAGKLRAKLRQKRLPESSDVSVASSAVQVTRTRKQRSPGPEGSKAEPEPEAVPEGEPSSEPEPEGKPEPEGEPTSEPEGEPQSGSTGHHHDLKPSDSSLQYHQWAPRENLGIHPMDCIDLVMGGARGTLSRIRDYYTRDRSTPRLDSFWGGTDDITSATGWEVDQKTILIFRRKLRASEPSDHSLDDGEMHVIWARGQEPGEYVHTPKSGLETEMPSIPNFYAADEIKYHGHGSQRGKTKISFIEKSEKKSAVGGGPVNCEDSFRHPSGCSNDPESKSPCQYLATWTYLSTSDSVKFVIQSRHTQKWTGIGFSETPEMRNSDAILGWVSSNGVSFMMDAYMPSYVPPQLDSSQNIRNESGTYEDGLVTISFIRPVKSTDPKDVSLDECRFFLFPIDGGSYNPVSKKIHKHDQTPISSAERVCISRNCKIVKPKLPDEVRYAFNIKLTGGFADGWKPPAKGTREFTEFGDRLKRSLETNLKKVEGFSKLQLFEVLRVGRDAVAKMELNVKPNSELAKMETVEQTLKDTLASGYVGSLQIDPKYLELSSPQVLSTEDDEDNVNAARTMLGPRVWIVIGCVSALIVLALVQAGLTLYKISGKTTSHKGSPSSGSGMAWRDYSETNFGYDAYDEKGLNGNAHGHHNGNGNAMAMTSYPYNGTLNGGNHTTGRPKHNGNGTSHYHSSSAVVPIQVANMSLPRPNTASHYQTHQHQVHQHHQPTAVAQSQHTKSRRQQANGNGGVHHGHHHVASPPAVHHHPAMHHSNNMNNPDFYFMPSQRKYSGEIVRVYVDHNKR